MEIIAIPLIIIFAISMIGITSLIHSKKIKEKITSINSYLISYKRCSLFTTGYGPFRVPNKGIYIYKVFYLCGNDKKEAWVRFGGFTGTKWVFDFTK